MIIITSSTITPITTANIYASSHHSTKHDKIVNTRKYSPWIQHTSRNSPLSISATGRSEEKPLAPASLPAPGGCTVSRHANSSGRILASYDRRGDRVKGEQRRCGGWGEGKDGGYASWGYCECDRCYAVCGWRTGKSVGWLGGWERVHVIRNYNNINNSVISAKDKQTKMDMAFIIIWKNSNHRTVIVMFEVLAATVIEVIIAY